MPQQPLDLEKVNEHILLSFEIAVIFGVSLFVGIFSWNLKNDIGFTIICVFMTILFLIATSMHGECP